MTIAVPVLWLRRCCRYPLFQQSQHFDPRWPWLSDPRTPKLALFRLLRSTSYGPRATGRAPPDPNWLCFAFPEPRTTGHESLARRAGPNWLRFSGRTLVFGPKIRKLGLFRILVFSRATCCWPGGPKLALFGFLVIGISCFPGSLAPSQLALFLRCNRRSWPKNRTIGFVSHFPSHEPRITGHWPEGPKLALFGILIPSRH